MIVGNSGDLKDYQVVIRLKNALNKGENYRDNIEKLRAYLELHIDKYRSIPEGSVLLTSPSTSGVNNLPTYIADILQNLLPEKNLTVIPASIDSFIKNETTVESKNKNAFAEFASNPAIFNIDTNSESFKLLSKAKDVFIVDDITSTGRTVFVLGKQLEKLGVNVSGSVVGIVGNTKMASETRIKKLTKILSAEMAKQIEKDVELVFGKVYTKAIEKALKETRENPEGKKNIARFVKNHAKKYREVFPKIIQKKTPKIGR